MSDGPHAPTEDDLTTLRQGIQEAIETGQPAAIEGLLQNLVHEIRITRRHHIQAVFRVPTTARTLNQGVRGSRNGRFGGANHPPPEHRLRAAKPQPGARGVVPRKK